MSRIKVNSLSALLFMVLLMATYFVQAQSLRDPTRPGIGGVSISENPQSVTEKLKLNSVLISSGSATAIFNNKIYAIGDLVQGVKIVRINNKGVWLADGRQFALYQAVTETKGQ
ncbi:MSHA biogenesis protein MshK [Shewanella psychrotolerans]|uniref:MSHA biogenesis protein MshK n=1 Tax=Shewanella psychrotolerans TaxID=2864206 RepID=UPI0021AD2B6F|nr:MSHA biogenesis protein MshK [Shewanella psychrotolerans]